MLKRVLTLAVFVAIVVAGYMNKDWLLATIEAGGWLSAGIAAVLVFILVFFPVVPFIAVASIMGGVFGVLQGTGIALFASVVGSVVMFWMSRYGFRDWAQKTIRKYPAVQGYEQMFEKNAFLAILFVRIVPVIPAPAVNIVCGVSHVRTVTFFLATLIGKIPAILVFTFAGSQFGDSKTTSFITYGLYFVTIMIASFLFMKRRQEQMLAAQEEQK